MGVFLPALCPHQLKRGRFKNAYLGLFRLLLVGETKCLRPLVGKMGVGEPVPNHLYSISFLSLSLFFEVSGVCIHLRVVRCHFH